MLTLEYLGLEKKLLSYLKVIHTILMTLLLCSQMSIHGPLGFLFYIVTVRDIFIAVILFWILGCYLFPTFGKIFIHFGKILAKIHKIGKIKTIFGLGMTPL